MRTPYGQSTVIQARVNSISAAPAVTISVTPTIPTQTLTWTDRPRATVAVGDITSGIILRVHWVRGYFMDNRAVTRTTGPVLRGAVFSWRAMDFYRKWMKRSQLQVTALHQPLQDLVSVYTGQRHK